MKDPIAKAVGALEYIRDHARSTSPELIAKYAEDGIAALRSVPLVPDFLNMSTEQVDEYLRSEGIDPDEEREYGRKVIEHLKKEVMPIAWIVHTTVGSDVITTYAASDIACLQLAKERFHQAAHAVHGDPIPVYTRSKENKKTVGLHHPTVPKEVWSQWLDEDHCGLLVTKCCNAQHIVPQWAWGKYGPITERRCAACGNFVVLVDGETLRPPKIELTDDQRRKMERLWFIYGNNGNKHTGANHAVLQGFIQHGEDSRKGMASNPPHGRPTKECLDAINRVLNPPKDDEETKSSA